MSTPVRFVIGPSGVQMDVGGISAGEAADRLEHCDAAFWAKVHEAAAGQPALEVVLHPPDVYPVRLAEPRGRTRAALSRHAPVHPDRLVWSAPRAGDDGNAVVTIARRDRIAAITAQLLGQGLPPPYFVDADGHALGAAADVQRPNRVTLAILLVALLSIPVTIAVGSWVQRQAIAQSAASASVAPDGRAFATAASHPTLAGSLAAIASALPADVRLVSVARRADGRIILVIDTPDPDRLREQLRDVPMFAALRDEAQEQTADATYRVAFAGPLR